MSQAAKITSPIKSKAAMMKSKENKEVVEEAWKQNLMKTSKGAKSNYHGDLWGTKGDYNEGLVYLSRFSKPGESFYDTTKEKEQAINDVAKDIQESLETSSSIPDSDKLRAKKRCASALSSLSWDSDFEHQIVNEGGLRALTSLAQLKDRITQMNVSVALCNIAHTEDLLGTMVAEGVVNALANLSTSDHPVTKFNTAVALCLLTMHNGSEGNVIRDGGITALMLLRESGSETELVCSKGLFNLSVIDAGQTKIVGQYLIPALISLANSKNLEIRSVAVKGLLNLSCLKNVRSRLTSLGVVGLVVSLAVQSSTVELKRYYTSILCNLSNRPSARTEMVQPVTPILILLSESNDEKTKEYCATTFDNLSSSAACQSHLVRQGAVPSLNKLSQCSHVPTKRRAVSSLKNLLLEPTGQERMVKDGIIPQLIDLSKTKDDEMQAQCVSAFNSLLSSKENAIELIKAGGVNVLKEFSSSESETLKNQCALALYNISRFSPGRLVEDGIIPSLIKMSYAVSDETKKLCCLTLRNLSCNQANQSTLAEQGVARCLIELLDMPNEEVKQNAAAALYNLSGSIESAESMVNDGVVSALINLTQSREEVTKLWCCVGLCSLSSCASVQERLVLQGVVPALIELSKKCEDENLKMRCVMALCNLSSLESCWPKMLEDDVVAAIVTLSSSYNKYIQQDSARLLCNVSCLKGSEFQVVESGAVTALSVIALIWTDNDETKILCARAMLNLMCDEGIHPQMCENGAVSALVRLSESTDTYLKGLCAQVFCNLSYTEVGRTEMQKPKKIRAVIQLCKSAGLDTKRLAIKCLSNMLYHVGSKLAPVVMEQGGLAALVILAKFPDAQIEESTISCFCIMSQSAEIRKAMVNSEQVTSAIISLSTSNKPTTKKLCTLSLSYLASLKENREQMVNQKVLPALCSLAEVDNMEVRRLCAISICSLSCEEGSRGRLISENVVPTLISLLNSRDEQTQRACASALCQLSWSATGQAQLVSKGGLRAIVACCDLDIIETQRECACAIANLSCGTDTQQWLIDDGAVPAIISLISSSDQITFSRSVLALRNLSWHEKSRALIVRKSAVTALVQLAKGSTGESKDVKGEEEEEEDEDNKQKEKKLVLATDDLSILKNISVTLCNLSMHVPNKNRMVNEGAVPLLIALSALHDKEVKEHCSVSLSQLSTKAVGIVSALIKLSGVNDTDDDDESGGTSEGRGPLPHPPEKKIDETFLLLTEAGTGISVDVPSGKAIWKKMSGGPSTSVSPKTPEQKFDESKKKISEEVDLDDESSGGGEGSVEFKKLYPIASFDPKGNIKITQKGDDLGGGESEGGSMYIKSSMSDLKGSEPMWGADGELIERSNDDMTSDGLAHENLSASVTSLTSTLGLTNELGNSDSNEKQSLPTLSKSPIKVTSSATPSPAKKEKNNVKLPSTAVVTSTTALKSSSPQTKQKMHQSKSTEDINNNSKVSLHEVANETSLVDSRPIVFMDVELNGRVAGRVIFLLFTDVCPITAENFRCLCTGERGVSDSGTVLSYKGSPFHRVIPGFMAQGGDIVKKDGTSGESIYGPSFDDENFLLKHKKEGMLSMANSKKNSNGSQFFVTLSKTSWLNKKHVVFGRVIEGMEIMKMLERLGSESGKTSVSAIIADCGQLVFPTPKETEVTFAESREESEEMNTATPSKFPSTSPLKGRPSPSSTNKAKKIKK